MKGSERGDKITVCRSKDRNVMGEGVKSRVRGKEKGTKQDVTDIRERTNRERKEVWSSTKGIRWDKR